MILNKKTPYYTNRQLEEYNNNKKKYSNKTSGIDSGFSSFPSTAYWRELKGTITVDDPTNELFHNAKPSTVPEEDTHVCNVPFNQKYNFDTDITVPDFWGMVSVFDLRSNGRIILHSNK